MSQDNQSDFLELDVAVEESPVRQPVAQNKTSII